MTHNVDGTGCPVVGKGGHVHVDAVGAANHPAQSVSLHIETLHSQ